MAIIVDKYGKKIKIDSIALRRSKFSSFRQFLEVLKKANDHRKLFFIDYEGIDFLLSPQELKTILESINGICIFTISARSPEFHFQYRFLVENYLRLTKKYSNLLLCVVTGHPNDKSIDKNMDTEKAFHNIFTRIRRLYSKPVFLGAENISLKKIQYLETLYSPIIPIYTTQ